MPFKLRCGIENGDQDVTIGGGLIRGQLLNLDSAVHHAAPRSVIIAGKMSAVMIEEKAAAARSLPIRAASKRAKASPAFLALALGSIEASERR